MAISAGGLVLGSESKPVTAKMCCELLGIWCYASLSVVRLGRDNVDATVDDSAVVFGH
jgi:hypothetical protein